MMVIPSFLKQLTDEKKLKHVDSLWSEFDSPSKAAQVVSLEHFEKFKDATDALTSVTSLIEGKLSKRLKKALKKITARHEGETFAVADPKLANAIHDKFGVNCQATEAVQRLMTCIRSQVASLVPEWNPEEEAAMQLAISHGYVFFDFIHLHDFIPNDDTKSVYLTNINNDRTRHYY